MRRAPALLVLSILFAVSGAAGLVHEVAWARGLGQCLGNSLQSQASVLVAFLGGLGLGAAFGGRAAGRLRAPIGAYALIEIFVAIYGALSPALIGRLAGVLESAGTVFGEAVPLAALRLGLALLALLPPTIAMGATLPILVRAAADAGSEDRSAVPVLYGANTLGAAFGALCGSFVLLPLLGTRLTFLAAAGLNLLSAAAAAALAARAVPPTPRAQEGDRREPAAFNAALAGLAPAGTLVPAAAAAASGLAGALLQFGWTRAATLAFGSSVYALGSVLAAYILGLGAGPLLFRRFLRRPGGAAVFALGSAGLSSIVLLPFLGRLPILAAGLSGLLGGSPALWVTAQFLILAALLLLPTMAQGAAFPALALVASGERPAAGATGAVYAASTFGSVTGFLLAGFVAAPSFGTEMTLASGALVSLGAAALILLWPPSADVPAPVRKRPAWRRAAALGALGLGPLMLAAVPSWDPALMTSGGFLYGPVYGSAAGGGGIAAAMRRRGTILFSRDGAAGIVTVRRSAAGILSLQINGRTEASSAGDLGTQILAAQLPMLLHRDPQDVLVIGVASGVSLGAAATHPLRSLQAVEIAPAVVEAARLFQEFNGRVLDDPRLRLVIDDARSLLLARPATYDVIISQPSNPWVAGVSNLFTVEFYRIARRRLRPGGRFGQWVQAYRIEPEALRGVVRTFLEVFPEASLWEESAGGGDFFLVGDGPLRIDPGRLEERSGGRVGEDLRRAGVEDLPDLLARFVAGPAELRVMASGAPLLTDDDLWLEWRAPLSMVHDTLRVPVDLFDRHRAPVMSFLEGPSAGDPAIAAALSGRLRRRAERLAILAGLRDADLWALQDPYLAAGIAYLRAGQPVEAAAALARGAAENPGSAQVSFLLGEAYRAAGLPMPAEVALRAAVGLDPGLAPAWNALGAVCSSLGRTDEARLAFEQALGADPEDAPARNNLGALFLRAGDLPAAEEALRRALAADPSLGPAAANLGLVLRRRGDLEGAERQYRAALALDPLNADARYNFALLLADRGRMAEAIGELQTMLRANPADRSAAEALDRIRGPQPRGRDAPPR